MPKGDYKKKLIDNYQQQMDELNRNIESLSEAEKLRNEGNLNAGLSQIMGSIAAGFNKPNITAAEIRAGAKPSDMSQNILGQSDMASRIMQQMGNQSYSNTLDKIKEMGKGRALKNDLYKTLAKLQSQERMARMARGASRGLGLTVGQQAVDKNFAKEYSDFVAGGGYADVDKNLAQLRDVHKLLKDPNVDNLTGRVIGSTPRSIRELIMPQSVNVQEAVEEVVQRNLRLILGAQFTQKEGERLISRAYNPKMDEAENAKRVGRLLGAIERAAAQKIRAARYFEQNGTLVGFKGHVPGVSEFRELNLGGTSKSSYSSSEAFADTPSGDKNLKNIPYDVLFNNIKNSSTDVNDAQIEEYIFKTYGRRP